MTAKRFTETVSTGIVTDNVTGKEYDCEMRIDDELLKFLNKLADEYEQYKKNSISLKQLYKILEENKEHFLSLSECFSEKLFIKTIFRNIDEDIESMEEEE